MRARDLLSSTTPQPLVAEYYRPVEYLRRVEERHPGADVRAWDRRIRSWRSDGWKLVRSSSGEVELYHVDADPAERFDLAGLEPERVAAMSAALELWLLEREPGDGEASQAPLPGADDAFERVLRSLGYVK